MTGSSDTSKKPSQGSFFMSPVWPFFSLVKMMTPWHRPQVSGEHPGGPWNGQISLCTPWFKEWPCSLFIVVDTNSLPQSEMWEEREKCRKLVCGSWNTERGRGSSSGNMGFGDVQWSSYMSCLSWVCFSWTVGSHDRFWSEGVTKFECLQGR